MEACTTSLHNNELLEIFIMCSQNACNQFAHLEILMRPRPKLKIASQLYKQAKAGFAYFAFYIRVSNSVLNQDSWLKSRLVNPECKFTKSYSQTYDFSYLHLAWIDLSFPISFFKRKGYIKIHKLKQWIKFYLRVCPNPAGASCSKIG